MAYIFLTFQKLFLIASIDGVWKPSNGFLFVVLIIGALLTAGVAISALSFYEDFYWGDKEFREQLRLNSFRKLRSPTKQP